MTRKFWFASSLCVVALAVACAKESATPTSPTQVGATNTGAAADGSTLKVTAPTPVSPINNIALQPGDAVRLVVANSSGKFADGLTIRYEFSVVNAAGAEAFNRQVPAGSGATTAVTLDVLLDAEQPFRWRARARYDGAAGPWSDYASFVSPKSAGYIRGNELYDPLINGQTVGVPNGPISFSNKGANLQDFSSYIHYVMPQAVEEGEFSMIIGNIKSFMDGEKTKLFAMAQGFDDLVTNEYRATFEKRGSGLIAWRFIARDDQIDTVGGERVFVDMNRSHEYFFKASWRANFFRLTIQQDGPTGPIIYDFGKPWVGRGYTPNPHVAFVGAPAGRSGIESATVPGMVVRQVWLSTQPRPAGLN